MTQKPVKVAFQMGGVTIPISRLMPTKTLPPNVSQTAKYKQTEVSVREVGVIEPIVVFAHQDGSGNYLLLDGHMRIQILENMGITETICVLSTDDESVTFNRVLSRVTTIQEHFMIMETIKKGASEEDLARKLGVDVHKIKEKTNLLRGICPEAVEILKTRDVPQETFRVLRKMNEYRQIEVAELMVATNNFSGTNAKALLTITPKDKLVEKDMPKQVDGLSPEHLAKIETEMVNLETDYKLAEDSLADDVLTVIVFRGYLANIMKNPEVADYLSREEPEIFQEFKKILDSDNPGNGAL